MMVNTAARGRQLLLRLLAGFAAYINLHGGKIRPLRVTVSLPPVAPTFEPSAFAMDGSVLTGIRPR
jgi:hypothetical protein